MNAKTKKRSTKSRSEADDVPKMTYAETMLMDAIAASAPRSGAVLVAGNRSGHSVVAAAKTWPLARVRAHAFDFHHCRAIRNRLVEAGLDAEDAFCSADVGGEEPYSTALFMTTPRSMPAELVLDQLQDIHLSLADGGELWAAFEGDPDDALKTMKQVWSKVHVVKREKHAILFRAVKFGEPVKTRSFAAEWKSSVPGGGELSFTTRPGCFCHRRADAGGLALAEAAAKEVETVPADDEPYRILDMGCGCGIVGILTADAFRRLYPNRPFSLTMIDSHARAIDAARTNAARAGIEAEFILADDGLPRGRAGEFDLFLGNPPYYSEYRIADVFLETAYRALKPRGTCLSVVKTATGLLSLQEKYFRSAENFSRRGYCILRSFRV